MYLILFCIRYLERLATELLFRLPNNLKFDSTSYRFVGYGALSGNMLHGRIIQNNKIDAYLGQVSLNKG